MGKSKIIFPELSYKIMKVIFEVHNELGPGFMETIYHKALISELELNNFAVECEKIIHISYKEKKIGTHRLDIVVDGKIIIELKTVESISIHYKKQLISYLKPTGYKLGILVNFPKSKVEYYRVINK
ncbi:GxxExxY protein [bacterium]|nr:GxxExxY protein [bacterium]